MRSVRVIPCLDVDEGRVVERGGARVLVGGVSVLAHLVSRGSRGLRIEVEEGLWDLVSRGLVTADGSPGGRVIVALLPTAPLTLGPRRRLASRWRR